MLDRRTSIHQIADVRPGEINASTSRAMESVVVSLGCKTIFKRPLLGAKNQGEATRSSSYSKNSLPREEDSAPARRALRFTPSPSLSRPLSFPVFPLPVFRVWCFCVSHQRSPRQRGTVLGFERYPFSVQIDFIPPLPQQASTTASSQTKFADTQRPPTT